ncbi:restriction endonuclease [Spirosoma linguale]|uniref:Uncharacterized protein n=1 Tax=Spirosoma linguale (strain ATCC 33905 / DSM 74 / LMG 10896 / Claus 1) TaxID=504472 RepID=D2QEU4_SPILD|nr:hypothetical protein Slin_5319 [Spirosoma linguale DSM 74]
MNVDDFNPLIGSAIHVDPKRRYWLVRTEGGDLYDHFRHDSLIAIGFNQISLESIDESIKRGGDKPVNFLAEIIRAKMPDYRLPRYAAGQLLRFVKEIKRNDIVLIPSFGSQKITIGEVLETPITIDNDAYNVIQPKDGPMVSNYTKRRKIKWLKEVSRNRLDPVLYKLLYSHHIVSEATPYANPIDNLLNDFYVKGKETHIVLEVTTKHDIAARTLFDMGSSLLDLVDQFCKDNELGIDTSDVDIKLSLRSPGKIELTTKKAGIAALLGIIIVGIVGGGFNMYSGQSDPGVSEQTDPPRLWVGTAQS